MKRMWVLLLGFFFLLQTQGIAHCDTRNGPVVTAARKALETGNVNYILIWIPEKDEILVKDYYNKTLEVRKLNPGLQKWADDYFFETVVRIHRAGEGEPYTGLKDSAAAEEPIARVEKSLQLKSPELIFQLLNASVQAGINDKFRETLSKINYDPNKVNAGRAYVKEYVTLIHYVESIYNTIKEKEEAPGLAAETVVLTDDKEMAKAVPSANDTFGKSDSFNRFALFVILAATGLVVSIQLFFSHRSGKKKIKSTGTPHHRIHHTKRA